MQYIVICSQVCEALVAAKQVPPRLGHLSALGVYNSVELAQARAEEEDAQGSCRHFVLAAS